MRTIPLSFREELFAQQSGEVDVWLFTISHPSYPGTLRLSTKPSVRLSETPLRYGIVSRSQTYVFCPMDLVIPDDVEDRAPAFRVMIENVDRELVGILRSMVTPGSATVELVLESAPDTVVIDYPDFEFTASQGNADAVVIEMSIPALDTIPFPAGTFNPSSFGGLF